MKRKLTKQEKELCRIGINNRKKRIKNLERELRYFNEFNVFQDKWKKYLEDKEKNTKAKKKLIIETTRKTLIEQIEFEKNALKVEKGQLENGVEIKEMTGVN